LLLQLLGAALPEIADDRRTQEALLGVADRGSNRAVKGRRPKRLDKSTQAETAPGTVTVSQPALGILAEMGRSVFGIQPEETARRGSAVQRASVPEDAEGVGASPLRSARPR